MRASTKKSGASIDASLPQDGRALGERLLYWLAFGLVVVGLINSMPGIPGLDTWAKDLAGRPGFSIRKFPYEYFYPLAFLAMMVIVALKHSTWRQDAEGRGHLRAAGLLLDILLVVAALTICLTYMNEIDSICLSDRITGERARLIEQSMVIARENAALFGLPEPTTVDDPKCVNSVGSLLVPIMTFSIAVFLAYNVRVWGLPLVLVAIVVASYTLATTLIWFVFGPDDISKYLVTKLGGEPRTLSDGVPRLHDALTNNASGLLGRFLDIILNEIFPYLILGSLFASSAGGQSLIKLAFRWTRNLRGGPAHAAVVSSAFFGTISGGPVVNVMSTGVLTIPMMLRRGYSPVFAGGVEAAASSGGSIMPPIMGVAAFVLAALTAVPYSQVIVAALIPAIAYFFCLFLSVVFQARKQNIQAIGRITDEMRIGRQDGLNLLMILVPILVILLLLLTPKENVGCGFLGDMFGADRTFEGGTCTTHALPWFLQLVQNAAGDVGSAGWWAVILLMGLLFLDPDVRRAPLRLVTALSNGGVLISTLYLMFLAVSIIDFCLKLTGLPFYISVDILGLLNSWDLAAGNVGMAQFVALLMTMILAVLLGMGMPAVPAYINVALLMGPALSGLGIATFTAHMFIFYFAVASAITPPVAVAAFAAASITRAEPMATGLSAVKSGIVIFVIPFIFAFYPELLLIDAARINPTSSGVVIQYLAGYESRPNLVQMTFVVLKVLLSLYLIAAALARFDFGPISRSGVVMRIALALAVLSGSVVVSLLGAATAVAMILQNFMSSKQLKLQTH